MPFQRAPESAVPGPTSSFAASTTLLDDQRPLRIARQMMAWLSAVALALAVAANFLERHFTARGPMLLVAALFIAAWARLTWQQQRRVLGLRTALDLGVAAGVLGTVFLAGLRTLL
jgi:hypothetical protein